jgi:archaellum component FlaC
MKKKIINGFLMAALMLTATTSFVSCKDNVDDELVGVYNNLAAQKTALEKRISDLETDLNAKIKANSDAIAQNKAAIDKINGELSDIKTKLASIDADIEQMKGQIAELEEKLNALTDRVNNLETKVDIVMEAFENMIQDFYADQFVNNAFGTINTPFVQVKGLAALFGENMTYIEEFPTTDASVIVGGEEGKGTKLEAADIKGAKTFAIPEVITLKERNAGKLYFYARANDQSKFDINNYKLTLKSATGKVAPVTFTNLAQSDTEAWWGTWKSSVNDLYTTGASAEEAWFEADANIATVDLVPSKFELKKFINLEEIKNDVNTAWKNIKAAKGESKDVIVKTIGKEIAQILINFYSGKMNASALGNGNMSYTPLRLYLSRFDEDGEEYIVKATPLDIFATAVTPLSYNSFYKMEGNAKLDEEKISDVEKTVTKLGAKLGATKMAEKVNKYLEKAANYIMNKVQNHQLTRAIEPCILFGGAEGIDRLNSGTIIDKPGTMEIMMTSPTEELLAPAYLKYIAVVKDGKVLQQATVAGAVQYQELEFPESGTYQVVLSAVDYHGFVVNKKYDVIVK